jgi:glycosyltransferase involved in cell wall biosynthesis
MRILLITPYFVPYNNPRALRWTQVANHWCQSGIQVDVITGKHPHEEYPTVSEQTIFRPAFPSPASRRPTRKRKSTAGLAMARRLYRILFKNWLWPDDSRGWQQPALQRAWELIDQNTYDALVTVSLPFSAHLVGQKIKRQYPDLPWLVDIGDPFSLQEGHLLNHPWLFQKKNRRAEFEVLTQADRIVCTNVGCRNLYLKTFTSLDPEKLLVIPPTSSLAPVQKRQDDTTKPLQVGYFGRFSQGLREPRNLLPVIKQLQRHLDAEWHFFGDTTGLLAAALRRQSDMGTYITQHPLLQANELLFAMEKMDILLSLGNTTDFQVPSKIADYLQSGLPILHLSQLPDTDPTWAILQEHPLACKLPLQPSGEVVQQVARQLRAWKGKTVSTAQGKALAKAMRVATVAESYRVALREISDPS